MYWIKTARTNAVKVSVLLAGAALLCLLNIFLQSTPASAVAGINEQVSYQARLLDSSGAVVPDGTYNMEFKIYQDGDGCVGGGSSPCGGTLEWTETRTGTNRVRVVNGYFSVQLGAVTPFGTSVDWNQDTLWLSINIGGTGGTPSWDSEMTPFRRLTASPYALNAGKLGGLDWDQFVQLAPSALQVDSSTLSSIAINKTGASGNILQLQNNGSDVAIVDNSGSVLTSALDTISAGTLSIGTSTSTAVIIGSTTNNSPVTIDSGTGAINIGTGAQARTINIGTGSAAQTLNLGSTNTSTATTLTAGGTKLIADNTGINILGAGTSGAGGRLYFGDIPNVAIGESGTTDTDALAFHGANGFLFTSGFGTEALRFSIDQFGDIRVGQSDTNGALFVLDTKTNSGDPIGNNGAMYYNSNASKFRCFEASTWKDCVTDPQGNSSQTQTTFTATSSTFTTYGDSQAATVTVPPSGKVRVTYGFYGHPTDSATTRILRMRLLMSGANSGTLSLHDNACSVRNVVPGFGSASSVSWIQTGLTPGATTFTSQFAISTGDASVESHHVSVSGVGTTN